MTKLGSLIGVSKRFGRNAALSDVSLDLCPATTTVLLGNNGAGKSTLLRCILGLLVPDAGQVRVLGSDPARDSAARTRIGYVPDHPDVPGWMTVRDLSRWLAGQLPNWDEARADRLVERLEVPLRTPFEALSRGEAAKAMLAMALVPAPPLVVLDEPFARLAPPARDEILRVFVEEAPVEGGAALVATHDLEVATRLADRILMLDGGRIVTKRTIDDLANTSAGSPADVLRGLYPTCHAEVGSR